MATGNARVVVLLDSWRGDLQRLSNAEFASASALIGDVVDENATAELYSSVGTSLKALVEESERIATAGRALASEWEAIEAAWRRKYGIIRKRASRRCAPSSWAGSAARQRSRDGRLAEVLGAIEKAEIAAVARVSALDVPFPEELEAGAGKVRSAIDAAAHGDREQLWALIVTIAERSCRAGRTSWTRTFFPRRIGSLRGEHRSA